MGFGHTWLCGGAQQQTWAHMPQRLMATLPPFTFLNREAMAVTICQAILFFFFLNYFIHVSIDSPGTIQGVKNYSEVVGGLSHAPHVGDSVQPQHGRGQS